MMTQIIRLIVEKQSQEDHIRILKQQQQEFSGNIDSKMLELELIWRILDADAMGAKINFLRYKSHQVDCLRKSIESST